MDHTGATFHIDVTTNGKNIKLADSGARTDDTLVLGAGNDMQLYHDGAGSYIDNNTGPLYIRNNVDNDDGGNILIQAKSGENGIVVQDDEGVSSLLYTSDADDE